jgi:hypothetical protein
MDDSFWAQKIFIIFPFNVKGVGGSVLQIFT